MTGSDDPAVQAEAAALGADAFFQKPLSCQRFMELGDIIQVLVFGTVQEGCSPMVSGKRV